MFSFLTFVSVSPLPEMTLSTLILALHARPLKFGPLSITIPLCLSAYFSVAGLKIDAAGLGGAWSGVYAVLAMRRGRTMPIRQKFTARGFVRGVAIGLGTVNAVAGCWTFYTGDREAEQKERERTGKWGASVMTGKDSEAANS